MSRPDPTVESILADAVEIASPADRRAFVERACGGDPELLARVERLADQYFRAGSFLDHPPLVETAVFPAPALPPGTVVGPYKLLEQIGEGGMGVVYVADQTHPVRRTVALKLIKPGMDSGQVVARFEQERQALALMDHPHIAKVLDAGTTDAGRPFFAMELVRGVPITDYCDQARLTVRGRLGLFAQVCRAVQHAHMKGVIHRDLKPTNVLVTSHDGVPVPKVIDFGIAKAVGPRLTDQTVYTGFAQMVGTPLYMSPEQAEFNELGVDTRSDVYSLGVVLYELLTGTTPFDRERLRRAGYDELRRIIREEEPPRPSARLSTLGAALSTTSQRRGVAPRVLTQAVRGELDWIVMRALEKDRTRRYESASALAADVQRYLADEPVEACPPTAGYRLRKFARRNRVALGTGAAVLSALLAGAGVSVWQMIAARRAELAQAAARKKADERTDLAREVIQDFYQKVAEDWLGDEPQLEGVQRAFLERAVQFSTQVLAERPTEPKSRLASAETARAVGHVRFALGKYQDAEPYFHRAIDEFAAVWQETGDPAALLGLGKTRWNLASQRYRQDRFQDAEPIARQALADTESYLATAAGTDPQLRYEAQIQAAWCRLAIGSCQVGSGHPKDAEATFRQAADGCRLLLAERPDDIRALGLIRGALLNISQAVGNQPGQREEAIKSAEEAVDMASRLVRLEPRKRGHREDLAQSQYALGVLRFMQGRFDLAELPAREAVRHLQFLADEFPTNQVYRDRLSSNHTLLGAVLAALHRWDDAERSLRKAEEYFRDRAAREPSLRTRAEWCRALDRLGILLKDRGRTSEAEQVHRTNVGVRRIMAAEDRANPVRQGELGAALHNLAICLKRADRYDEAVDLFKEAIRVQQAALDARPQANLHRTFLRHHHLDLAMCLADHPTPTARNPAEAVRYARKGMDLKPDNDPGVWGYFEVVQYRAGNVADALAAFDKWAARPTSEGDDTCLFRYFRALALLKVGRRGEAEADFADAEAAHEKLCNSGAVPPQITRVRAEATALLGRVVVPPPRPVPGVADGAKKKS